MTDTPFRSWIARAEQFGAGGSFEIGIPMRDGVELAADVYLPTDPPTGPPADLPTDIGSGSVPAIVEITPYGKDNGPLMSDDARLYQSNGYAFVAVDVRGRGKSEGEWVAFVNDAADTHDVIEWTAVQPWCNGKVGTTGLSYMGWVQWAGASERPPHLCAMISTSAAGRWQQEIPHTNGIFQLYFAWWSFVTRRRIEESYALEHADWDEILGTLPYAAIGDVINAGGPTWEIVSGRDTLDDFWKALRYDDRYHEIDVPCLHVSGWYDLEDLLGAFHHYEHMREASPARNSQFLLVGPWSHVKSRYPDSECGGVEFGEAAAFDMDTEHLRWFDHWLKGRATGLGEVDRVRVFEPGRNTWRGASEWPLCDSLLSLYLTPGSLVAEQPEDDSRLALVYDPLDPVLTGLDVRRYPFEDVPLEQTANELRDDVICYTSEPVTEPLTVSGWPTLELYASSDCDDTDWHVKLTDVTPDGRSIRVTQGCLRAACRDSLEDPQPLVPGETYRFDIELWPTHHVVLPGHSIRVTVTGSDFPWFARGLNRFGAVRSQADPRVATNTIGHGREYPSRLLLPVERGTASEPPPRI